MRARATSVGSGAGLVGRSTTVTAGLLRACQAVRTRGIIRAFIRRDFREHIFDDIVKDSVTASRLSDESIGRLKKNVIKSCRPFIKIKLTTKMVETHE